MPDSRPPKLKKELGLFDVYAIAVGATISSGLFLLPGLAAVEAGPAVPLAYLLAGALLIPGILSKAELATAMPRAGGVYYFIDRSLGPLMGTMGRFGTWFVLILKSAFALIGVGAYLHLFLPDLNTAPVAALFAVTLGMLNILGAKKSTRFQMYMVVGLLSLLIWFTGVGIPAVELANLDGMFDQAAASLVSTAGLVVVGYVGLTKVASVAEEVRNPERNIPLGMLLAFLTSVVIYTIGTTVMIGVASAGTLAANGGDLTPVATVAEMLVGRPGAVVMTVAAVLAFSSVGNAGILSASRYPLAMSRDRVLPAFMGKIGRFGTPTTAIAISVAMIVLFVTVFDPTKIAKLAGAFQLMMFALLSLAVIVMRESRLDSYDPGYRSPFYPWLHMLGILAPIWLVAQQGWLPAAFTGGLIMFGTLWYAYYARDHADREGAIYHVFERLGRQRDAGLDRELRQIMKEKGLRAADPFEAVVTDADVIDAADGTTFRQVIWEAAAHLAESCNTSARELGEGFLRGTVVGMTPVSHGAALPHLRLPGLTGSRMVLVRGRSKIPMDVEMEFDALHSAGDIHAIFFLVSPEADPGQHLRVLAQLAGRVDDHDFMDAWLTAADDQALKEALLRDDRVLALMIARGAPTESLIGSKLRNMDMPDETLVALVRRDEAMVIPRGDTVFEEGDRLTIIGEPAGLDTLRRRLTVHR